ncbi:MAG: YicC family protein [Oceanospirillales bacterium]|nr:MAG: YicC family protein [Oceanospirillales bacterium]
MTRSMTAFAALNTNLGETEVKWEIRSVNSRYLEIHFRLPDNYRSLEAQLRELLRQQLTRGKVEVSLRLNDGQSNSTLSVNDALVESLLAAISQVESHMPTSTTLSPIDLLRWPGVLAQQDYCKVEDSQLLECFENVLQSLSEGRLREGEKLNEIIRQRLDAIAQILLELRKELPKIIKRQETLLKERILRLVTEADPSRIEQETALLIQKADVEEELDRLEVHISEVRRILGHNEPIGRRLDFLMQELNREANTLSSKSIALFSTQAAIDLKVLIEQMREQIQNIE